MIFGSAIIAVLAATPIGGASAAVPERYLLALDQIAGVLSPGATVREFARPSIGAGRIEIVLAEPVLTFPAAGGSLRFPEARFVFMERAGAPTTMTGGLSGTGSVVRPDGMAVPFHAPGLAFTGTADSLTGGLLSLSISGSGIRTELSGKDLATGALRYDVALSTKAGSGSVEATRLSLADVTLTDARGTVVGRTAAIERRAEKDIEGRALSGAERTVLDVQAMRLGREGAPAVLSFSSLRLADDTAPGERGQAIAGDLAVAGLHLGLSDVPAIDAESVRARYVLKDVGHLMLAALFGRLRSDRRQGIETTPTVSALPGMFSGGSIDLDLKGLRTAGALKKVDGAQIGLVLSDVSPRAVDGTLTARLRGIEGPATEDWAQFEDVDVELAIDRLPPDLYNATAADVPFLDAAVPMLDGAGTALRVKRYELVGNGFVLNGDGDAKADARSAAGMVGTVRLSVSDFEAFLADKLDRRDPPADGDTMRFFDFIRAAAAPGANAAERRFDIRFGGDDGLIVVNGRRER